MLLLVGFKVRFRVVLKEVQNRNGLVRLGELLQLDRLLNIFKAWINWIQQVFLDCCQLAVWDVFIDQIKLSCPHQNIGPSTEQKEGFLRAGCSLVKLTRQRFDGKKRCLCKCSLYFLRRQQSICHLLRENMLFSPSDQIFCHMKDIIHLNHPKSWQCFQLEIMRQLSHQALWLHTEVALLLYKNTLVHDFSHPVLT